MNGHERVKGIRKTTPLVIVCVLLGTFNVGAAQDLGGMSSQLADASARVDPLGLALLAWTIMSILYFGGGIFDRRAERRTRNEEALIRREMESRHVADRASLMVDLRRISERDDDFKTRIERSVGVMTSVITRNNELLVEHEREAKMRETSYKAALEDAGKRAEMRYQSVQEQIRIDSAADMRNLAEILGDKIVSGQREFADTFARTFAIELPKYLQPMFDRLQANVTLTHETGAPFSVTIDKPSTEQIASQSEAPAEAPAQTDTPITDPTDPRAKG